MTENIENIQRIEGYIARKWGLESSLPSNHPFKLDKREWLLSQIAQCPESSARELTGKLNEKTLVDDQVSLSAAELAGYGIVLVNEVAELI